jgi:hypothetical protein
VRGLLQSGLRLGELCIKLLVFGIEFLGLGVKLLCFGVEIFISVVAGCEVNGVRGLVRRSEHSHWRQNAQTPCERSCSCQGE